MPAALPNSAPVDIPMANPIIAPYLTLSKQVGPRGRFPVIGMSTTYSELTETTAVFWNSELFSWYVEMRSMGVANVL